MGNGNGEWGMGAVDGNKNIIWLENFFYSHKIVFFSSKSPFT